MRVASTRDTAVVGPQRFSSVGGRQSSAALRKTGIVSLRPISLFITKRLAEELRERFYPDAPVA